MAVPLKCKKGIIITNAFQTILDKSRRHGAKSKVCKPNKTWMKVLNFIIDQ